jgi:hypothetical protein
MKKILIFLLILLATELSFGQFCTKYKIQYIGTIKTDAVKVIKIKLPTTLSLHGFNNEFIEIESEGNDINFQINSHLTEPFTDAKGLLKLFKKERQFIPIIFIVTKAGKKREITINLTWDRVELSKIEDKIMFSLFKMNLNEIKID